MEQSLSETKLNLINCNENSNNKEKNDNKSIKYEKKEEILNSKHNKTSNSKNKYNYQSKNDNKPKYEELQNFKERAKYINPLFVEYYKELLNLSEEDYTEFIKTLILKLPITFRITKTK